MTKLSRTLTSILRHNAPRLNLDLDDRAMVSVNALLKLEEIKSLKVTFDNLMEAVSLCEKQRFIMVKNPDTNEWRIGATQGHSFKVNSETLLEPLTLEEIKRRKFTIFIHGTYFESLAIIRKSGLNRMSRTHIHIASGYPKDGVKSGFRSSCEIIIFIDVPRAINDGYLFYISKNGVILTEGNNNGYLPPNYILKVVDKKTKKIINI